MFCLSVGLWAVAFRCQAVNERRGKDQGVRRGERVEEKAARGKQELTCQGDEALTLCDVGSVKERRSFGLQN